MAQLEVSESNVPGLLTKLKTREWMSPLFQRDFVWSTADVVGLVNSIIDAKPIGMVTLWEQADEPAIKLEPISIEDRGDKGEKVQRPFGSRTDHPGKYYAVLDGRQRSTAIAMAFGGLRPRARRLRNSGRFFLDVKATDDPERVVFLTEVEVDRRNLSTLAVAVSQGLFPLECDDPSNFFGQWMNYLQIIRDPEYYEEGKLPNAAELTRRTDVVKAAFDGIINTKIAVYVVPKDYDLATICEVFQTLNTTGTKVSTVDLIHSNVYNDTVGDAGGPLLLREALDELGDLEGAIGWSSARERPELIAQMVAAMHVALDTKPEARRISASRDAKITSVKSADLLAIPSKFWRTVFNSSASLASFIGGFQQAVAGGPFGQAECPYPASATIYVALRWYHEYDSGPSVHWTVEHLDRLYRAFFWRNALFSRYDQGFLSQIGTDIKSMKDFLATTRQDESFDSWKTRASAWLDEYFIVGKPDRELISSIVRDGSEAGALRKAVRLLHYARANLDIYKQDSTIRYGSEALQLHHIYPKDWCANNSSGDLYEYIDPAAAGCDWVNSSANLMPMHRDTNILWRKKNPAQFLSDLEVDFDSRAETWNRYFINREAYGHLIRGGDGLADFWEARASAIVDEIARRTEV